MRGSAARRRARSALVPLLLAGWLLAAGGCGRGAERPPYPHESILAVVMELKLFLAQDPWRTPPGTDLEGRNIFSVTLERLDALEGIAGPEYADSLSFARGESLERLGRRSEAAAAFAAAAAAGTRLAPAAATRAEAARRMAGLTDRAAFTSTLEGYLNDLDVLERRLAEWIAENAPFPYGSFARVERERAREERIRLLLANRFVMENSAGRAVELARGFIDENVESHRHGQNLLLAGELFETLARDWAASHRPGSSDFDGGPPWSEWVDQARTLYGRAAQADGDPAKPEAQARLRALDAWVLRVRS